MSGSQSLLVEGMTCSHCVGAVTKAVTAVEGVESVEIELVPDGRSRVIVTADDEVSDDALVQAVVAAGYTPVSE